MPNKDDKFTKRRQKITQRLGFLRLGQFGVSLGNHLGYIPHFL